MAKKFDANEWAENARGANACKTCAHPEIVDVIKIIMQARADGRSRASVRQIREMLQKEFDFSIARSGLTAHMQRCEPELHAKAWPKN